MGEDVALRRAGYCPAAGNADFPALTPCLEDNTDADVVVVQFGSNDVRFPDNQNVVWSSSDAGDGTPTQFVLPEHLQGLKAILDQVQAQDQACVVITPPPIWSNEGGINPTDYETANERLDELRQFQLAEARSHGCVHVDLYQTFLDYEEANGEVAMLALYAACPAKGVTQGPGGGDCVHLSAAGNAVMGAHVRDAIQASASRSACGDGLDNDGDGLIDLADPGCGNFSDLDEHASELVCDDGVDNDGDGKADYLAAGGGDPGCYNALSTRENPQCQDGLNNDDRIGIDFDGGRSLDLDDNGVVDAQFNPATPAISPADPQCIGKPWGDTESSGSSCGLGFELVFLAPLIARLGWRRRA